jgi:hypothetical protein|tara:strand:- start:373 stop:864 length:492 start_codon:yes stop_codon:yes gene_type:complete
LARLVGPPAHVKAALLCLDLSLHKEALVMLSLGLHDPDTHHDAGGLRDDERLVLKLCAARSALIESSFERDKFQQTQTHDDELTETQKTSTDVAFGHCMAALSIDSTDPRPFELLGDLHLVDRRHGEGTYCVSQILTHTVFPHETDAFFYWYQRRKRTRTPWR